MVGWDGVNAKHKPSLSVVFWVACNFSGIIEKESLQTEDPQQIDGLQKSEEIIMFWV